MIVGGGWEFVAGFVGFDFDGVEDESLAVGGGGSEGVVGEFDVLFGAFGEVVCA